jgi:hypothetical protein
MGLGTQRITQSLNVYTSRIHPELYFSMHQDDSDEQSEGDDWFRRPPHQRGDDLVLVSMVRSVFSSLHPFSGFKKWDEGDFDRPSFRPGLQNPRSQHQGCRAVPMLVNHRLHHHESLIEGGHGHHQPPSYSVHFQPTE